MIWPIVLSHRKTSNNQLIELNIENLVRVRIQFNTSMFYTHTQNTTISQLITRSTNLVNVCTTNRNQLWLVFVTIVTNWWLDTNRGSLPFKSCTDYIENLRTWIQTQQPVSNPRKNLHHYYSDSSLAFTTFGNWKNTIDESLYYPNIDRIWNKYH